VILMTSNNKNKSLEARPPHSTPGRPAVIVTSLPSGGNVDLSSSSSSPKPGCRVSSCLPSFPVPPPPSDSLGDVRGRRVMAFLAWQRQLLRGALPRSLSAQPATQPSARPSSQPRTQPIAHPSTHLPRQSIMQRSTNPTTRLSALPTESKSSHTDT
jgi:hypothetical protein